MSTILSYLLNIVIQIICSAQRNSQFLRTVLHCTALKWFSQPWNHNNSPYSWIWQIFWIYYLVLITHTPPKSPSKMALDAQSNVSSTLHIFRHPYVDNWYSGMLKCHNLSSSLCGTTHLPQCQHRYPRGLPALQREKYPSHPKSWHKYFSTFLYLPNHSQRFTPVPLLPVSGTQ